MRSQQPCLKNRCAWLGQVAVAMIGVALVAAWQLPSWVFMWVLAFAIFVGFKYLTYCEARAGGLAASKLTRYLYLFCWPGMSLKEFAKRTSVTPAYPIADWTAAALKTLVGAGLVWVAVPSIPADAWLVRGWAGMIGIIMMLHFGTFHLLALALQTCGFNARPNMRAPLLASSLADFWGRRWNTAFNVLADRYGFRLLIPRIGSHAALGVVFVVSGLLHEAVITVPARGGYGLPTAYFGLQAAGIFLERQRLFRKRPWLKRVFAWVVLVVPLGWLFPPVFVRNVMLPMLHAIGATGNML